MLTLNKWLSKFSLKTVLVAPFVILLVVTVGLTDYLSFQTSQAAVSQMTAQLRREITARIEQKLESHLETPLQINRLNANAFYLGVIDVDDTETLQHYFWGQIQQFSMVDLISLGTEQGEYVEAQQYHVGPVRVGFASQATEGVLEIWKTDDQGELTDLVLSRPGYDPRQRPWYQNAVQAGRPAWSGIYTLFSETQLTISISEPLYDQAGQLMGVTSINLNLAQISEFLSSLQVGQHGQTYIMERTGDQAGLLIATSTGERLFQSVANNEIERLAATDSRFPLVQNSAGYLLTQRGGLATIEQPAQFNITVGEEPLFLQVTPFQDERGIDWLIVVAIPQTEFIGQIWQNIYTNGLLSLLALLVAVAVGLVIGRWIVQPIIRLNEAAKAMATGDWEQQVILPARHDEVGQLANSFNRMAQQLKESFDTLEANEAKYRTLFEDSKDMIYITHPTGKLIDVNPAGLKLFQYTKEEFKAINVRDLYVEPTTRDKLGQLLQQHGSVTDFEVKLRKRDGSEMTCLMSASVRYDAAGNIISYEGIIRDITPRKQAEEELRRHRDHLEEIVADRTAELTTTNEHLQQEITKRQQAKAELEQTFQQLYNSRQLLRTVIDSTPNLIFVKDSSLRWILVNQAMADILEMTPQEIVGKNDLELGYPQEYVLGDPETGQRGFWDDDRAVLAGETIYYPHDAVKQTKGMEGRLFDVYKYPLRDNNGEIVGIVCLGHDITQITEAEGALRKLSRAVEQSSSAIIITDLQGNVDFINPAFTAITGYTFDEIKGQNLRLLKSNQQSAEFYQAMWQTISRGEVWQGELRNRKKNGELYWVFEKISPIKDETGDIIHYLAIQEDVTERKQAEEAIRAANADLSRRVKELSTLNQITQAITTVTELQTVLDTVVQELGRVFKAHTSGIALFVDSRTELKVVADYQRPANFVSSVGAIIPVAGNPSTQQVVEQRQSIVVPDAQTSPLTESIHELMRRQQIHCLMIVPLLVRGEVIGTMGVTSNELGYVFTPTDVELAETIAGQIAGAVELAHLFEQEQQQRQVAESLREVAITLNRSLDQETVINKILEQLRQVVQYDSASLFLKAGSEIVLTAGVGLRDGDIGYRAPLMSDHLASQVCRQQQPLTIPNVRQHPLWKVELSDSRIRGWMAAPLFTGEEAIGVLCIDSFEVDSYGSEESKILQLFANQAAIAIQNAQLYHEVQREKQLFETMLLNSPVATVILDLNYDVISWNPQAEMLFGYTQAETMGRNIYDLVTHPTYRPDAIDYGRRAATGKIEHIITQRARKDGQLVDIELSAVQIKIEGQPIGYLVLYHDITELQQVRRDIEAANHEIRALNERLKHENLRLEAEVNVVRQLQQMILPTPTELKQVPGLEIAALMEPADEVGGDYYDVLQHNGRVNIGIGDVTGHGLASGVVMLMAQMGVRTLLTAEESDFNRLLTVLNRAIYENIQRMAANKSLTLALLDYQAGQLTLSGQHESVIVVRKQGEVELIDTIDLGFPIGLDDDISDFINQLTLQLEPGEGVVLYTDGITEAENEADEQYGLERLCEVISRHWSQSAEAIKEAVVREVRQHIGQQTMYDDLTLVVLKQR